MMAPLPTPSHIADRPELPRVRLEVRAPSGRAVTYEVGADDFLIGGSAGCDLRLPASNLPPVICQISRKSDSVRVRRLTPVLTVLLNGNPLPANTTTPVSSGDVLSLDGIEITVAVQQSAAATIVVPKFVPLEVEPTRVLSTSADAAEGERKLNERKRLLDAEEAARREEWTRRDAELIRRARDLDRQTEELESDRVLWYCRRQEIEQELERQRSALGITGVQKTDLDAEASRAVEGRTLRARERLLKEYQDRRDELSRQQDDLRAADARLQADRHNLDSELERRLTAERTGIESVAGDVVAKARAEAAEILRQAEAESARRRAELASELVDHEPRLRDLNDQKAEIVGTSRELARQRELLATDREVFDKSRATFEAHQAAETERLMTWENILVDRAADVTRRTNTVNDDRTALDHDRVQFQEDLVRLERRTAAIERRSGDRNALTRRGKFGWNS